MKTSKWMIHNDLSGKCWIPENTFPGRPGWFEPVPRRVYIHTPWGCLIAALPGHGPWMWVKS